MPILDRYIARQFVFNFLMLFAVISGLYILLDLILNFDEFAAATRQASGGFFERLGDLIARAWDLYWPQLFPLYVYIAGLLPVGAAGFTLAGFVRNRELVAMMAGGISLRRVAVPLVLLTIAANALLLVDQEFIVPRLAHGLVEGHSKVKRAAPRKIRLRFSADSHGSLFNAFFDPRTGGMESLTVLRRREAQPGVFDRALERVTAAQAFWNADRGGWDLVNGQLLREPPTPAGGIASGDVDYRRTIEEIQFLPSDLSPDTILLREHQRFRQLLSSAQLTELIGSPLVDTRELQRIFHARYSMLLVNVLVLLMGLPLFLLRSPGPLLLPSVRAAAMCVPAWAGGFVMHQLSPHFLPPAAIAWLPVAIYLPIAFYMVESIET